MKEALIESDTDQEGEKGGRGMGGKKTLIGRENSDTGSSTQLERHSSINQGIACGDSV